MGLTLIHGRVGTGKSTYIYNEIIKTIKNCEKIYIITPEQFSFNAEIKLLEILEERSTLKAEVLTFKRMAYRVINEVGGATETTLSICGRFMLLYNIISKNLKNLTYLNNQDGNIDLISTTITELKKHKINIEDIKQAVDKTTDENMKIKLTDIYISYKAYEESIQNKYIDEDDILTILNEKITKSTLFKNSVIYIDEFVGFTKQEYNIIENLLHLTKDVKIAICTDELEITKSPELDIFYENKKTVQRLTDIAKKIKIVINKPIKLEKTYRFKNESLKHLEKNIFKTPYKVYEETPELEIFAAQSIYKEIENVAKQIKELINKGYRYKEISIITKNIEKYSSIILAVFGNYKIPAYIDQKKDLASNILIKYILSLLDIFSKNWSYESVFEYIKTGMIDIDKEDLNYLENYVIKWGIRGNTWYKEDWKFGADESNLENINKLRMQIITPLLKFKENLFGIKTVFEVTKNLYNFLIENNIPKIMEVKIEKLQQIGELQTANEYISIWNIILEILDEIVLVLGEEKITFEKYKDTLKLGLKNKDLGAIPAANDQVIIGDIDRSKNSQIKAVFIIGLNDGVFPSPIQNEGFLDDNNREALKEMGLEIAKTTRERIYEEQFNIYKVFGIAQEKIYLSYPLSDANFKTLRPSVLIHKLKKIFENIKEVYEQPDEPSLFVQPSLFVHCNIPEKIDKEKIEKLYGNPLKVSVSKLEKYRSCPFSFYLEYGLRIKEKKKFRIEAIDTGTFMHEVIDKFFTKINEEKLDIKSFTNEQIKPIAAEIIDERLSLAKNYIFISTPKFIALSNRLKKVVTEAIEYIVYQLKSSDFNIASNEKDFRRIIELENGAKIELTGKIDRIDLAKMPQGNFVRIIDYKSRIKSLDLNDIYYGISLQLLVYLEEAAKLEMAEPTGVLYFRVMENIAKKNKNLTPEEIEEEIRKQFKMRGFVLSDIKVVEMMDKETKSGYSKIIPVMLSKGEIVEGKSSVVTSEQFEDINKYIQKLLKQISREILTGNINITPYYKKGEKPCRFCKYKSICGFTPGYCGNNYNFITPFKKEEILEKMKQ